MLSGRRGVLVASAAEHVDPEHCVVFGQALDGFGRDRLCAWCEGEKGARGASGTTSAALCESRPTFVFRLWNVGWGYPLGTKSSPSNQR
jgi:hypothetical protein